MHIVEQFKLLNGMATTRRYSQTKMHNEENILEHSAFVGIVATTLAMEYNNLMSRQPDIYSNSSVDIGIVAQRALFHDVEEFLTGDIPRPTKYHSKESVEAFEKIADEGMKRILMNLEVSKQTESQVYELWRDSKSGLEGLFIAIADLSAVVFKLWSECTLMGNKSLLLVCDRILDYIETRRNKIGEYCDAGGPGYWFLNDYLLQLGNLAAEAGCE